MDDNRPQATHPRADGDNAASSAAASLHGSRVDAQGADSDNAASSAAASLHGSRVDAQGADLDHGLRFSARLPPPGGTGGAAPGDDQHDAARDSRRGRILVADDNRDAASSLATLLTLDGHEVRVAHDGAQAIAEAASFRPQIALLDIGMPKHNGYDVARAIRSAPWGRSMVLVAVTGWGQSDDKRRAREAGFDHHFTKPVDLDVLGVFVTDALARPPAG